MGSAFTHFSIMASEVFLAIVLLQQTVNSASIGSNQPSCEPVSRFAQTYYTWYKDNPKAIEFINTCVDTWNCDSLTQANPNCSKYFSWCDYENPIRTEKHFLSFLFPKKEKRYRRLERMCGYSKYPGTQGCYRLLYSAEYWQ